MGVVFNRWRNWNRSPGAAGTTPTAKLKPTDAGKDTPLFDLGPAGTLDELLERLPAMDQVSVTLGEKPLAIVLAPPPNRMDQSCLPISDMARARR